ncbi:hypothetical protein ACF0H5_009131 [Mactra antiquata]
MDQVVCQSLCLVQTVTKSELQIDPTVLEDRIPKEHEPPVTYIRLLEDQLMTVAVFVLRSGKRLPLHDHPGMTGLLKVVHGSVTIKSYSLIEDNSYTVPQSLSDYLFQRYGRHIPVYPAKYEGSTVFTENDHCSVISPDNKNIHEICSESGTAAFLDVLSPPYNHKAVNDPEYRPCSYFKDLTVDDSSDVRYLVQIRAPGDYWCDEVPYTGPKLSQL